jgi:hypothetical protein
MTKRTPGPAKGTPAKGHRPATPPATLEQKMLWARWQLFPANARPTAKQLAAAVGQGRDTVARKLAASGAGFTAAQLLAANVLLDQHTPAPWAVLPSVPEETNMLPE